MKFKGFQTYKLASAPDTGVNPPTGFIFLWETVDESNNLVLNYRLSDGTDKTFSAGTGGGSLAEPTVLTASCNAESGKFYTNKNATLDFELSIPANMDDGSQFGVLDTINFNPDNVDITNLQCWFPFDELTGDRVDTINGTIATSVNSVGHSSGKKYGCASFVCQFAIPCDFRQFHIRGYQG